MKSPDRSPGFPATRLSSPLTKKDLRVPQRTLREIERIEKWIETERSVDSDWDSKGMPGAGLCVLFYGPPGSGKTLAATVLGQSTGRAVYRVDLSNVISKYIGETEKNLAQIFDLAEANNWILFFDEADALFGKRTDVTSSNDSFANQEVSYLLDRIEAHSGVVIFSTNLRSNIDGAFSRRFQMSILFERPNRERKPIF